MKIEQQRRDIPSQRSAASESMQADLQRSRDVFAGYTRLQEAGDVYLPRHPAEDAKDFRIRLQNTPWYGAYSRTIKGMVGMVFREDPELGEDVPAPIAVHLENVDNAGTHFDVFAKALFEDGMIAGHVGILVDMPRVEGTGLSRADESALGLRPYWVAIRKEDIVSWRTAIMKGRRLLEQVVLLESTVEPAGEFVDQVVIRYRQLRNDNGLITWKLWVRMDDGGIERYSIESEGVITNQTEIPLAMAYANKTDSMMSIPPLIDLAVANLDHRRLRSDFWHSLHKNNVPTPWITGGGGDEPVELGPNTLIMLPDGASAGYLEPTGAAAAATSKELESVKADMAALGLAMLAPQKRAAETAEAKRIDKSQSDSALATASRSLQDALETALQFHANFMKLPTGGSVSINREFDGEPLAPEALKALSELQANGQLSLESLWLLMGERGALPDDFDPEIELGRIQSEMGPEPIQQPGVFDESTN